MGKPWLLWTHDPCPEGGWHLAGEFDTQEEAVQAARVYHQEQKKRHQDMVEHCLEGDRKFKTIWLHGMSCYDKCKVTGGDVFNLEYGDEEVKEDIKVIRKLVLEFFVGDEAKTDLWFSSENPLLGGISPNQMIMVGRVRKLAMFVEQQLAENQGPEKGGG